MLRLKEKPSEWIQFTAVMGLGANIIVWLLARQGIVSPAVSLTTAILALLAIAIAFARPRWFRGFYRGGMTVSFHIGQTFGKVLLILFFFLLVTPMGLLLRLLGKDLLHLKPSAGEKSCWQKANSSREFDRMF
ncbi:MAG: hypothetical protein AB3N64_07120 [Puniceicoccaceae bacterium]